MRIPPLFSERFERVREYGPFFIRAIIGFHLVYGTQDNVFDRARMEEFAEFLRVRSVPEPLFAAHLSAYAQFLCGILFVLGAATRPAAAVMVINFVAALVIAHLGQPYPANFPPLMMLAGSLFLLLHGPGKVSFDERTRRAPPPAPG